MLKTALLGLWQKLSAFRIMMASIGVFLLSLWQKVPLLRKLSLPPVVKAHKKKFLIVLLLSVIIPTLVLLIIYLSEPKSKPLHIVHANITSTQATISWSTKIPTKGALIVSQKDSFPIIPFASQFLIKDDGEKRIKTQKRYATHKVTVTHLKPNTTYYYRVYQGNHGVYTGRFKTAPVLRSTGNPTMVYGQVYAADAKTPVMGVLVYLQMTAKGRRSQVLSAMTNEKGRWSINISDIRTLDLTKRFAVTVTTQENIIVDAGNKGAFRAATTPDNDQPWPNIILKKK